MPPPVYLPRGCVREAFCINYFKILKKVNYLCSKF